MKERNRERVKQPSCEIAGPRDIGRGNVSATRRSEGGEANQDLPHCVNTLFCSEISVRIKLHSNKEIIFGRCIAYRFSFFSRKKVRRVKIHNKRVFCLVSLHGTDAIRSLSYLSTMCTSLTSLSLSLSQFRPWLRFSDSQIRLSYLHSFLPQHCFASLYPL